MIGDRVIAWLGPLDLNEKNRSVPKAASGKIGELQRHHALRGARMRRSMARLSTLKNTKTLKLIVTLFVDPDSIDKRNSA